MKDQGLEKMFLIISESHCTITELFMSCLSNNKYKINK